MTVPRGKHPPLDRARRDHQQRQHANQMRANGSPGNDAALLVLFERLFPSASWNAWRAFFGRFAASRRARPTPH